MITTLIKLMYFDKEGEGNTYYPFQSSCGYTLNKKKETNIIRAIIAQWAGMALMGLAKTSLFEHFSKSKSAAKLAAKMNGVLGGHSQGALALGAILFIGSWIAIYNITQKTPIVEHRLPYTINQVLAGTVYWIGVICCLAPFTLLFIR